MDDILKQISEKLISRGWYLSTAESCTGGMVAKWITDRAGSSGWFERGLVTYSNQAKIDLLGVNSVTLEQFGAVSLEVAREMAAGAVSYSPAQIGLGITGVAGPDGGTENKPVGMVCFAWAKQAIDSSNNDIEIIDDIQYFDGDRNSVRIAAATHAVKRLLQFI